jgi:hypothetical protein
MNTDQVAYYIQGESTAIERITHQLAICVPCNLRRETSEWVDRSLSRWTCTLLRIQNLIEMNAPQLSINSSLKRAPCVQHRYVVVNDEVSFLP